MLFFLPVTKTAPCCNISFLGITHVLFQFNFILVEWKAFSVSLFGRANPDSDIKSKRKTSVQFVYIAEII